MTVDLSLIPQNRVENLSTQLGATVNTSGNQTISGEKTFTSTTRLTAATPQITYKSTNMDITQSGWTSGRNTIAWCQDKNGNESGGVYNSIDTNSNNIFTSMYVMSRKTGSQVSSHLRIGIDGNGVAYTSAPAPSASNSTSSTNIATVGWVNNPATSTNVVHRSDNETIEGTKTFKNNISINTENENHSEIKLYATKFSTNDTSLDETSYGGKVFTYDKNNSAFGVMESGKMTNGNNFIQWNLRNRTNESWTPNGGVVRLSTNDTASFFDFPKCTTKATTTSTAATNKVAVVITNYKSGTNWYRVWSDGWIEQGGEFTCTTSNWHSFSFHKAFTDTNYSIWGSGGDVNKTARASAGNGAGTFLAFMGLSTSGATCYSGDDASFNNTIVRWVACGY